MQVMSVSTAPVFAGFCVWSFVYHSYLLSESGHQQQQGSLALDRCKTPLKSWGRHSSRPCPLTNWRAYSCIESRFYRMSCVNGSEHNISGSQHLDQMAGMSALVCSHKNTWYSWARGRGCSSLGGLLGMLAPLLDLSSAGTSPPTRRPVHEQLVLRGRACSPAESAARVCLPLSMHGLTSGAESTLNVTPSCIFRCTLVWPVLSGK